MACQVVQGPYIGADGRVKHMRLIGEDIPEQPIQGTSIRTLSEPHGCVSAGYTTGNCAKVLSGPHTGLCGKV